MPANKGFFLLPSRLTKAMQQGVLAAARAVVKQALLFRPSMPSGHSFNYSMTNCGEVGWVARGGKLEMYQDNTEDNVSAPITSINLGETGIFVRVFVLSGFIHNNETK